MPVTAKYYGRVFLALWNKEIDWLDDTIKVSLHTSAYSPDQDTHDYKDDLTSEISGTGYTSGGATLSGKTIAYNNSTNTITLDANDVTWSGASFTARTAVVYNATPGTDATRPLICYQQESVDITASGGDFTIVWNASGICNVVVS